MAEPIIRIEDLGKKYLIQHRDGARYRALRDVLAGSLNSVLGRLRGRAPTGPRTSSEEFWALRDVSCDIHEGEVVGIIGRNGAGKSTLLKVLSRITEPSAGRVTLRGRVASLLEVGTGFHPELTGRENVYLNGSILGMRRKEIERKFDEIVAFAGVERVLDSPVKRYSSGMYVRLAFAVAAHLEPEILVIDEVLAVGDASFQRKCFDKVGQIRQSGRTVLIVTHNLGAMLTLCTSAIQLECGQLVGRGSAEAQVTDYLARLARAAEKSLADRKDREGDQRLRLTQIIFRNATGTPVEQALSGEELRVALRCDAVDPHLLADYVAISCWNRDGIKLFHVDNVQIGCLFEGTGTRREYECRIPRLPLPPGLYHLNVALMTGGKLLDHIYSAATIEVMPGDFFRVGRTTNHEGGAVLIDHHWVEQA